MLQNNLKECFFPLLFWLKCFLVFVFLNYTRTAVFARAAVIYLFILFYYSCWIILFFCYINNGSALKGVPRIKPAENYHPALYFSTALWLISASLSALFLLNGLLLSHNWPGNRAKHLAAIESDISLGSEMESKYWTYIGPCLSGGVNTKGL